LPSDAALNVVYSISQPAELPEHLVQTIIEKAEGNPFFLEELTRAVIEHRDCQAEMIVPDTIQGVLSARIDRLPEKHKHLLQTASVLGREFSPRLLGEVWDGSGALDALLSELKRLEFLFERTGAEESLYVFKHALTQEVAYESLLTSRRRALHAAVGRTLETFYAERLAERAEELAHHLTLGEVWEKAFVYLCTAGEKARQAFANQEAIAFYTQAIDVSGRITPSLDEAQLLPVYEGRGLVWRLLTKYDDAIADFQVMLQMARASGNQHMEGESLCYLAYAHHQKMSEDHMPFVEQYAQEALQLSQKTGDQKVRARSLVSLGTVEQVRGNLSEAVKKLEESFHIIRRGGYTDSLPPALLLLSAQNYWQGNFQSALRLSQEGVDVSRAIFDGFHELFCFGFLCQSHWSCGNYGKALVVLHEAMTKAHERENKFFLGRLTNTLGWFYHECGDIARAIEYDSESMELGRTSRVSNVEVSALINLGLDYLAFGQHDRAHSYLAPTLDRVEREAFGAHRWRWTIRLHIGLAELSYTTGDYDQALRYVEEGLKEAQRASSQKYVALGWALRGKIIAKLGDTETAGAELQRAFTLADQLQSPSLIYPIAYDLGQWNESTGNERDAMSLYGKAKATIEQMATAVEDEALRSTFLQSALVQEIHERATRLGG
jgi:tetratricopeptide (TPR) repeat protein